MDNFSPSVNIIRDKVSELHYIPTPNAERVLEQLNQYILYGIKSFYIVGSFGTGKSSFLLALQEQITRGRRIFKTPIHFNGKAKYEALNIIGDARSLEDSIRETLDVNSNKDLIESLDLYYKKVSKSKNGLLISIDEFGKFLEYASKNEPEKELYLIQKLAEYTNDKNKNILLITTLHQAFDVYKHNLDEVVRNEWDKVKGRLKEITFNEPVEQLLHLAAIYINGKPIDSVKNDLIKLFKTIHISKAYPLINSLDQRLAEKLFPLDLLAGGVLAKSLQRYGQNERSLFTFLKTSDYKKNIDNKSKLFNLDSVYNYLIENYYSLLSSKYNPDYLKWSVIRNTVERCEILFESNAESKIKLVKTIGLLNIFSPAGSKINEPFLKDYGNISLGIKDVESELELLEKRKLIRYQDYSQTYVLFEGTDIDIDLALNDADNYLNQYPDIVDKLKEYFQFPYLPAKSSYIRRGTPRFFEFIISEKPVVMRPTDEIDGIINLIFSDNSDIQEIRSISKSNKEAILYGVYKNARQIKLTIKEIDRVNYVLETNPEDRVVQRELKNLKESLILELNQLVIGSLYGNKSGIIWLFSGRHQRIKAKSDFNKLLSYIIDRVYPDTPIFNNELINREKLPGSITIARRALLERLMEKQAEKDLGFISDKYPPEKSIYLSLLKSTGIHRMINSEYHLTEPKDTNFKSLWEASEEFYSSSKNAKRSLIDLVEILKNKPFKLKKGLLDHWIPIYLIIKRNDYALFHENSYIPYLNIDLIDLIIRYPKNYYIKAFDIRGVKINLFNRYRRLINKSQNDSVTNQSFIETIRPFLAFYRALPNYSKNTNRLSKEAISLRDAISKSKDPEKTFFEDFPNAIGYSTTKLYKSDKYLEKYTNDLENYIREIRTSYDELINRIEYFILNELGIKRFDFADYKMQIQNRYKSIKEYILLPYQKSFFQRINSNIEDRNSWLSSIIQPLIGNNLENIDDKDEKLIYEKLSNIFKELDNLCDFAILKIDQGKEHAVRIEITPLNDIPLNKVVRISKDKENKSLENTLRSNLSRDKSANQMVLIKLLKEQLIND